MPQIRRFQNSDLPALVRLWTAHFQSQGVRMEAEVSSAVFEQAVLNRIFFVRDQLLVATSDADDHPCGFAHWQENLRAPSAANVVALCVDPPADQERVADELLAGCETAIRAAGKSICYGGADPRDLTGYGGLPPLGPGEGVLEQDKIAIAAYQRAEFAADRRLTRFRVQLLNYRPPVDRSLVMFRRSATVQSQLETPENWRRAAALSHVDVERFTATTRSGEVIAWAEVLLGDPEARVLPLGVAILDGWGSDSSFDPQDASRFVISAALKELAARHVYAIESVADDQHPADAEMLRSLHFQPIGQGTVFKKAVDKTAT